MLLQTSKHYKDNSCCDIYTYSFVRLQYRENAPGSSFSNIGGFGVLSPLTCKDENGLTQEHTE